MPTTTASPCRPCCTGVQVSIQRRKGPRRCIPPSLVALHWSLLLVPFLCLFLAGTLVPPGPASALSINEHLLPGGLRDTVHALHTTVTTRLRDSPFFFLTSRCLDYHPTLPYHTPLHLWDYLTLPRLFQGHGKRYFWPWLSSHRVASPYSILSLDAHPLWGVTLGHSLSPIALRLSISSRTPAILTT